MAKHWEMVRESKYETVTVELDSFDGVAEEIFLEVKNLVEGGVFIFESAEDAAEFVANAYELGSEVFKEKWGPAYLAALKRILLPEESIEEKG